MTTLLSGTIWGSKFDSNSNDVLSAYNGTDTAVTYGNSTFAAKVIWGSKLDGNSNDVLGVYNGTDTSITYSSANGKIIQGAGFNGSTSKISISPTPVLGSTTTARSFSFWIKTTQVATNWIMTQQVASNAHSLFDIFIDAAGKVNLLMNPTNTGGDQLQAKSTTAVNGGTFTQVTITYDGSKTIAGIKFYINGVSDAAVSVQTGMTTTTVTIDEFILGVRGGFGSPFTGALDEFMVYTGVITAADIATIYNNGVGLQYPFMNGIINNGAGFAGTGKVAVSATPVAGATTTVRSFSFWVKTTGNTQWIFTQEVASNAHALFDVWITAAGKVEFLMNPTNGGASDALIADSTSAVNDGNWHHVVVTYDGSKSTAGVKFYIDGSSNATVSIQNNMTTTAVPIDEFVIGVRGNFGGALVGTVDELYVFNYVLPSGDVTTLWNGGVGIQYPFGMTLPSNASFLLNMI